MIRTLLRPVLGPIVRPLRRYWYERDMQSMRARVLRPSELAKLNCEYLTLTPGAQLSFYERYAKLFHEQEATAAINAEWRTRFADQEFVVPLRAASLWLDFDYAVSLSVHDLDVKLAYQTFLRHQFRPELFIDVGCNYGTHSLIFLKHGVPTLSIEPNASCHDYFLGLCAANSVTPKLIKTALGEGEGEVTIAYPKRETWLSTADPNLQAQLRQNFELIEQRVPVQSLDQLYQSQIEASMEGQRIKRVLMKIDTEGFELPVLKGAQDLLSRIKPYVYFEALPSADSFAAISALLSSFGYRVVPAAMHPFRAGESLSHSLDSKASANFLGIPPVAW
jgi:FkbM family methyltransferase